MLLSVAATSVSFHSPTHSMPSQHGWHTVAETEADTVWREKNSRCPNEHAYQFKSQRHQSVVCKPECGSLEGEG